MTKASLRRQRELEEREAAEQGTQGQSSEQLVDTPIQRSEIPRMDPPPPYDASHLPAHARNDQIPDPDKADLGPGCWNGGPGKTDGCMNYNSGSRGSNFVVEGCCNYDSREGCMNYESEDGCMNFQSLSGCMNYKSHDGCCNYEVSTGGGCMNYRTTRGGCMQCGSR